MAQYLNIIVKGCQTSDSETYFHLKYIMLLLQCTQWNQIPTSMGNELYCINSKTLVNVTQVKPDKPDGSPEVQLQEQQHWSSGTALLAVPG